MFKKFKKKIKKKFSNSGGQLKPDPDNVITQLPTHEPEECFNIGWQHLDRVTNRL